jgi:hypothetical protein
VTLAKFIWIKTLASLGAYGEDERQKRLRCVIENIDVHVMSFVALEC